MTRPTKVPNTRIGHLRPLERQPRQSRPDRMLQRVHVFVFPRREEGEVEDRKAGELREGAPCAVLTRDADGSELRELEGVREDEAGVDDQVPSPCAGEPTEDDVGAHADSGESEEEAEGEGRVVEGEESEDTFEQAGAERVRETGSAAFGVPEDRERVVFHADGAFCFCACH